MNSCPPVIIGFQKRDHAGVETGCQTLQICGEKKTGVSKLEELFVIL